MDPRWGAGKSPETCHTVAGLRSAVDFERNSIPVPAFMVYPLFTHLRVSEKTSKTKDVQVSVSVRQALESATSTEQAVELVSEAIIAKTSRVMAMPRSNLEAQRTPVAYGVDSLVSVDLKAWFKNELDATVVTQDVLGELTIYALAEKVVRRSVY